MNIIKSIFVIFLFTFAMNISAGDSFEFNPQAHTACLATIQADYVGFVDNSTNEKVGPELYADDTNADFFNFIKISVNNAISNNTKIILQFIQINSQNHGQYDCIIPDS